MTRTQTASKPLPGLASHHLAQPCLEEVSRHRSQGSKGSESERAAGCHRDSCPWSLARRGGRRRKWGWWCLQTPRRRLPASTQPPVTIAVTIRFIFIFTMFKMKHDDVSPCQRRTWWQGRRGSSWKLLRSRKQLISPEFSFQIEKYCILIVVFIISLIPPLGQIARSSWAKGLGRSQERRRKQRLTARSMEPEHQNKIQIQKQTVVETSDAKANTDHT